jgi:ABC-type transport system substrate-binding protein
MTRTNRQLTAEDMAWWMDITKKEGVLSFVFELVQTIEVVDRATLKVTMKSPHAEFLRLLAHESQGVFSKECYEAKDCLGVSTSSPSGMLATVSEAGIRLVLERNPEFYLKGLPYLDSHTVIPINDPAAAKAASATGGVTIETTPK